MTSTLTEERTGTGRYVNNFSYSNHFFLYIVLRCQLNQSSQVYVNTSFTLEYYILINVVS